MYRDIAIYTLSDVMNRGLLPFNRKTLLKLIHRRELRALNISKGRKPLYVVSLKAIKDFKKKYF